jgi:hypothetical protein
MAEAQPKKFDTIIARFFSETVVRQLLKNTRSSILDEVRILANENSVQFKGKTFNELFASFYDYLVMNYRSEYIYKNAIANKILLGKHSLNTSSMLQEFRVDQCKADTVVLNGTSNVYEIKTELDSLERLKKQIEAYSKVFDMVHVIAHQSQLKKLEDELPKRIGLMELTAKYSIKTIREAASGKKKVSPEVIFDSLRKQEYQNILLKHFSALPNVPNTKAYQTYKKYFVKLTPEIAHDEMVIELKKRGDNLVLKEFVSEVPAYFKAMALKAKFTQREAGRLSDLLSSPLPS